MTGRPPLPEPALLIITDRHQAGRPLPAVAAEAFAAGCRWLSLREKDLAPRDLSELLAELVALGRPRGARVMVHGDVAAAAAAGAAGVHLPRGGDLAGARRQLGARALIGISAHDLGEAEAAGGDADYLTLSPIFPSASKPGYGPALGLDGLRAVARRIERPIIALGGVTAGNAAACLQAGASGVAVMGTAMRAKSNEAAVCRLIAACRQAQRRSCSETPQG